MTPSTEIGLFAPPIMAAIVFVLTWNIERRANADTISGERLKIYASVCVFLMVVGYVVLWKEDIKAAWLASPVWMSLGLTGMTASVSYLVARSRRSQQTVIAEEEDVSAARFLPRPPDRSITRRIFAWFVITWGIAGLLGGVAAIIRAAIAR